MSQEQITMPCGCSYIGPTLITPCDMHVICDFCLSADPRWEYYAEDFDYPTGATALIPFDLVSQSKGSWAACDPCASMIESLDAKRLTARAMRHLVRKDPRIKKVEDAYRNRLDGIHRQFFDHRTGKRRKLKRPAYAEDLFRAKWMKVLESQAELVQWFQGTAEPFFDAQGNPIRAGMPDPTVSYGALYLSKMMSGKQEKRPGEDALSKEYRHDMAVELLRSGILLGLRQGDPYWIEQEMQDLCIAASESMPPQPLKATDLPSAAGFVVLEKEITIPVDPTNLKGWVRQTDDGEERVSFRAFSWAPHKLVEDGILITVYLDTPDDVYEKFKDEPHNIVPPFSIIEFFTWQWGHDYNRESYPRNAIAKWYCRFLTTFWTLVQQPLAMKSVGKPNRQTVRRLEREGAAKVSPVTVVTLRRIKSEHSEPDEGTEKRHVEWSHRWMVAGFWRKQYYPSLDDHRLVYINPYVKGPADKPLVVKQKVYKWTR